MKKDKRLEIWYDDVETELRKYELWILKRLRNRIETILNSYKDECEKKGIMKAREIVDAYINELDERIEQEGKIEDRDIL